MLSRVTNFGGSSAAETRCGDLLSTNQKTLPNGKAVGLEVEPNARATFVRGDDYSSGRFSVMPPKAMPPLVAVPIIWKVEYVPFPSRSPYAITVKAPDFALAVAWT